MIRFLIPFMAAALLGNPAQAFSDDTGMFDGLQFVSETELRKPQGQALSLCHTTREFRIWGVTITSNPVDYVLSSDGCITQIDATLTAVQLETAQSFDLIDASLPVTPENSQEQTMRNVAPWALIALAMLFIIFRRLTSLAGGGKKPLRSKASQRILTVMCYVARSRGAVDSKGVSIIGQTAKRLTQRNFKPSEIMRITDQIDMNLSMRDFIDFGTGLRDAEKDRMMRAAFYVALADGRMLPPEHEFLTNLAAGIGMPGEDFRRVMNLTFNDLDNYPPVLPNEAG
ncbi:TerB family tellurite resistance protein [Yoonia sp.]|uniref:TerB family tellurite resistance protein n=1 Tax=Yoonia sp. TaxID=2212373 RepID=UPI0035C83DAA